MDDVTVAKELAEIMDEVPETFRKDAFRVLLKYRLGMTRQRQKAGTSREAELTSGDATFSEFYRMLEPEPNANPQRFAAVAYYFRESLGELSVTREELNDTMREAGLRPAGNFPRDIKEATGRRNALLMPAREEKEGAPAWQLTRTGEEFIVERLNQE